MLSKKRLFQLHSWLGLSLGWLLFVVCLSGTIAVFGPELDWLIDPTRRIDPSSSPHEQEPASWEALHEAVVQAHPQAKVLAIEAPAAPYLAANALIAYGPQDFRLVFLNPSTAEVQGQGSLFNAKSFFRIFHKQFYMVPDGIGFHGTMLIGAFALILLVSVLTGMLFFKGWWKAIVRIRWHKGPRLLWSDLHRCLGAWVLLISLILALTGVYYWVEKAAEIAGAESISPAAEVHADYLVDHGPILDLLPIDTLVERAQTAFPEIRIDGVFPSVRTGDPFVVQGQASAKVVRSRANQVALNPYNGEVLEVRRGEQLSFLPRLIESVDPLHFGTFGGLATRVLWFVAGLILSFSILAGLLIHASRPITRKLIGVRRLVIGSILLSLLTLLAGGLSATVFIRSSLGLAHPALTVEPLAGGNFGPQIGMVHRYVDHSGKTRNLAVVFSAKRHLALARAEIAFGDERPENWLPGRNLGNQILFPVPAEFSLPSSVTIKLYPATGEAWTKPLELSEATAKLFRPLPQGPPKPGFPMALWGLMTGFGVLAFAPGIVMGIIARTHASR